MERRKEQNQNKKRIESEYKKNGTGRLADKRGVLHRLYTTVDNSKAFSTVFFVPFYFLFFAEKPAILLAWTVWEHRTAAIPPTPIYPLRIAALRGGFSVGRDGAGREVLRDRKEAH